MVVGRGAGKHIGVALGVACRSRFRLLGAKGPGSPVSPRRRDEGAETPSRSGPILSAALQGERVCCLGVWCIHHLPFIIQHGHSTKTAV